MAVYKRDMVDINLETGNIHRSFLSHAIGMKDQLADHFGIRVYRNGEPVNLTGVSVQGVFMPPQGDPIAITSGNIVSGNEAEVVLPQACYNYDGPFTLAIKLVDSTNSVTGTIRIVDGMVNNTHASGTVAPTSAVPSYQEVLAAYEQAVAVIGYSVRFDQSQALTDAQKETARDNIGAPSVATVVRFDQDQELTDAQKETARDNIGAPNVKAVKTDGDFAVVQGSLDQNNGKETESAIRIKTGFIKLPYFPFTISAENGYEIRYFSYDTDYEFVLASSWDSSHTFESSSRYIRLVIRKTSGEEITPDDFSNSISTDISDAECYILTRSLFYQDNVLKEHIKETNEEIDHVVSDSTFCIEQGSISGTNGDDVDLLTRIRTGFIRFDSAPGAVTVANGYKIRTYIYDDEYNFVNVVNEWVQSKTLNNITNRFRFVIKKDDESEITPADIDSVSLEFSDGTICIIPSKSLYHPLQTLMAEVKDLSPNNYSLNNVLTNKEDMIWSWWYYPQVISFKRVRNKLYWGYTTHDGHTGIAEYNLDTQEIRKNNLKKSDVDDHNGLAFYILSDGTIVCAYAGGHNTDSSIHIRRSSTPESIERFDDEIRLDSSGLTSYGQMLFYNEKLYIFYRVDNNKWKYRYSADYGRTWSVETTLVSADIQYYCRFMPTTSNGVIRICMYSNPGAADTNIRMGFFNLTDGKIYNSDNATALGTENIPYSDFDIIIPNEQDKTQRLFDVAITAPNRPLILYAPFSDANDSVYKVYDAGTITVIANGGESLWHPKYQDGCAWVGTDKIVSIRGYEGSDIVELYAYGSGTVSFIDTVYSEVKGSIPIRNARPIVDINGKAFLWHRGYYNVSDYTKFNTDAELHFFE